MVVLSYSRWSSEYTALSRRSPAVSPTDAHRGKTRHPLADLLGQRIFGIAYGHPDGNDAGRLPDDPTPGG